MFRKIIIFFLASLSLYFFANISLEIEVEFPKEKYVFLESKVYIDNLTGYNEKNSIKQVFSLNSKQNEIKFHFDLNNFLYIRKIRFDPINRDIGKIIIKSIKIDFLGTKKVVNLVNLKEEASLKPLHMLRKFQIVKDGLVLETGGNDPFLQIFDNFYFYLLKLFYIQLILYFIIFYSLISFLSYLFKQSSLDKKFIKYYYKLISYIDFDKKNILIFSIFSIFSLLLSKIFVILIERFYYENLISFKGILNTFLNDIIIVFSFILLLHLIVFIKNKFSVKTLNIFIFLLMILLMILGIFYTFSIFIYYDLGSYITKKDIILLFNHGGKDDIIYTLFSIKMLCFIVLIYMNFFLSFKVVKLLKEKYYYIFFFVLLIIGVFIKSVDKSYITDPYMKSPVLEILQASNKESKLNRSLLKDISIKDFDPLEHKNSSVPSEYKNLSAIFKNKNIIFFIMESTRQKNISLYGYNRETMPFLSHSIAKNAFVFYNAYVNQPRSAKTMLSLNLGIYPNPTFEDIIQKYNFIKNPQKSLLGIFKQEGYATFFGSMQEHYGGINWNPFLKKLVPSITLMDVNHLPKQFFKKKEDERNLVSNFLDWSSNAKNKYIAILWTKAAHYPYRSTVKHFEENTINDMYDNCLYSIDLALKELVAGLKKQNKLKDTVIVIFGDHGEAIKDKKDFGHGSYFYDHSIKIPFLIYNPLLESKKFNQRFQIKDIAETIFYLFGIKKNLNQSINIFKKSSLDTIYMSNVYQDFKLGMVYDKNKKFIYRPVYNKLYYYDLIQDPNEDLNYIKSLSSKERKKKRREVLQYYKYQINYIKKEILK